MGQNCCSCFKQYKEIPDYDDAYGSTAKSGVYNGMIVDQKFTSNFTFEQKFLWINPDNKTLHMSIYETKERRHKEASLTDVIGVERAPPVKFKKQVEDEADQTADLYLTVKFVRGGGIDLRFKTTAERDEWYKALLVYVEKKGE
jgi:hypothetical protein